MLCAKDNCIVLHLRKFVLIFPPYIARLIILCCYISYGLYSDLHFLFFLGFFSCRMAVEDLIRMAWPQIDSYGEAWLVSRNKMLMIFTEALSSDCLQLAQTVQVTSTLVADACQVNK